MNIRNIVRNIVLESINKYPNEITVFHGSHGHKENDIISNGLKSPTGYNNAGWYMVATDIESALFHASPETGEEAVVFEFKVPLDNLKWFGYPYFWPEYKRNENSSWFALREEIPSKFITKVHKISYDDFSKQKTKGF